MTRPSPASAAATPQDPVARRLEDGTPVLSAAAIASANSSDRLALHRTLEELFAALGADAIALEERQDAADACLFPLIRDEAGRRYRLCPRAGFYQVPDLWLKSTPASSFPELPAEGHPLRPPQPQGLVYARRDPAIDMIVSFEAIAIERDLDLFHAWMNDGRVAFFWELAKSKEDLRAYLERLQADQHAFGLIGSFDGEKAGYFEVYWGAEDRLGAHYDAHPYDRGWHGLIGNARFLGRARTAAWLRALTHLLFLDDVRTEKVVGEPNAAHRKLLRYADELAYRKVKEFDFPHKCAALMHCARTAFFARVRL
jgi:acetyl CoA:N6-hydroxylysine acetyl transferase